MDSSQLFWITLVPAAACALLAGLMAVTIRSDATRWAPAIGFGVLALVSHAAALQWPVDQLTAANASLQDRAEPPFLLFFGAFLWAGIAFAIASWRTP